MKICEHNITQHGGITDDKMLRDLLKEKLEDLTFENAMRRCRDVRVFQCELGQENQLHKLDSSSGQQWTIEQRNKTKKQ